MWCQITQHARNSERTTTTGSTGVRRTLRTGTRTRSNPERGEVTQVNVTWHQKVSTEYQGAVSFLLLISEGRRTS